MLSLSWPLTAACFVVQMLPEDLKADPATCVPRIPRQTQVEKQSGYRSIADRAHTVAVFAFIAAISPWISSIFSLVSG